MHISLDSALGRDQRLNSLGETINSIAAPAAAYSLRSLTGGDPKVVRVRRSSDNSEQDFTVSGVNSGALVDFVGSGNDGFVETWYDQSGNGKDATQTTAASQPKIVSSGSLVSGGLDFDGTNDFLPIPLTGHNIGNLSSFCVGKFDSASGNSDVMLSLGTASGNSRWYAPFGSSSNIRYGYGSASDAIANFSASTDVKIHTIIAGTTIGNASGFENGTLKGTATRVTTTSVGTIGIGGIDAVTDFPLNGKVQEVIVCQSDQSSKRTVIEANINSHYSIF